MKEKYPIKGSNTLYKVWGIIVLIFAALNGLRYLLILSFAILAPTFVNSLLSPYMMRGMSSTIGDTLGAYVAVAVILIILVVGIDMTKRISTGVILVREYIKAKWVFMVLAIVYFLEATVGFVIMIFSGLLGSVWLILFQVVIVGWNVATGIILISKSQKAYIDIPPEPGPGFSSVHGVIEGVYGNFKGKQVTLYPGGVCRIGRESGCDIQLVHPKVSRVHCMISMTANGRYQITDYSYNGTFYDNERLTKNIMVEVNPGGMLVIGEADNVLRLK